MLYVLSFVAGGVTAVSGVIIWMWFADRQMDKYLVDRIKEEKED